MVAHELRHPLAPMRSALAILRLQAAHPEALAIVEMLERQVSHMARLVEDLLDAGRIASGKLSVQKERVALGSLVDSALAQLSSLRFPYMPTHSIGWTQGCPTGTLKSRRYRPDGYSPDPDYALKKGG